MPAVGGRGGADIEPIDFGRQRCSLKVCGNFGNTKSLRKISAVCFGARIDQSGRTTIGLPQSENKFARYKSGADYPPTKHFLTYLWPRAKARWFVTRLLNA